MVVPELLTLMEEELFAYKLGNSTSGFRSVGLLNETLKKLTTLGKRWQLELLPHKYFFDTGRSTRITFFDSPLTGNITSSSLP